MKKQPQIFLAHASEDKEAVSQLYSQLTSRGFKPWLDKIDLIAGQNWQLEIPKAINKSDLFVACFSKKSVEKRGYVQKEFRLALDVYAQHPPGSVYLIPVKLDDCEMPNLQIPQLGVNLQDIHWVELWEEDGFEQLVAAIEYAVGTQERETGPETLGDVPSSLARVLLHGGKVDSVAFSPDGKLLASGGDRNDKTLKLWDLKSGRQLHDLHLWGDVNTIAFSPDGKWLASTCGNTLTVWNPKSARRLRDVTVRRELFGYFHAVAFSPDGRWLAAGCNKSIWLWSLDRGLSDLTLSASGSLDGHTGNVLFLAFSPDSKLLVSGSTNYVRSSDGKITPEKKPLRLWNFKSTREICSLELGGRVKSVAFSPDGRWLGLGGEELLNREGDYKDALKLWNIENDRKFRTLPGEIPSLLKNTSVDSIAFSPDSKLLASSGPHSNLKLWDPEHGRELCTLEHDWCAVAFSPDGKLLASAGTMDGKIKLWRASA